MSSLHGLATFLICTISMYMLYIMFLLVHSILQTISEYFLMISDDHRNQREQEQVIKISDNRLHHLPRS